MIPADVRKAINEKGLLNLGGAYGGALAIRWYTITWCRLWPFSRESALCDL